MRELLTPEPRLACRFCGCVTTHAYNCPRPDELRPVSFEYRQVLVRYGGEVVGVRYEPIPGTVRYEKEESGDR